MNYSVRHPERFQHGSAQKQIRITLIGVPEKVQKSAHIIEYSGGKCDTFIFEQRPERINELHSLKLRKVVFTEMNKLQDGESVKPGVECLRQPITGHPVVPEDVRPGFVKGIILEK